MTDQTDLPNGDDDTFTAEHVDFVMSRGACRIARRYLGHAIGDVIDDRPWAALEFAADRLSDDQFARAAKTRLRSAMKYAADRLTDAQLERAALNEPWYALRYAHHRLSDEQFARAAESEPDSAMIYAPARYRKLMGKDE